MNFVTTADGSKTIFNAQIGEHYHSTHGAVQESRHVFLKSGLHFLLNSKAVSHTSPLAILEIGFGTGLNFLLTADYCLQQSIALHYTGVEAYPLSLHMIQNTGYEQEIDHNLWNSFLAHYPSAFDQKQTLHSAITLEIAHLDVVDFNTQQQYDLMYFDAFAAVRQPEMWSEATLRQVCQFLKTGGVFVTYAITGNLKRTMKGLGFSIEKAPGAPGKREMLRAIKN